MLLDKVQQILSEDNGTKRQIADFIVNNSDVISNLTVKEIADKSYTSEASVVRFAQSLGYKKWREFINDYQEMLRLQQANSNVNVNLPFTQQSSIPSILDSIMSLKIESLRLTSKLIDFHVIQKCAQCVDRSERVVIFSELPNYYLAEVFKRKLLSIGIEIELAQSGEYGLRAISLGEKDCAIMISYSGNELINPGMQVKRLKSNGVKIIAITSEMDNYLQRNANYLLKITSNEHLYTKITNYASETAINYVLDVLFSVIFQLHFDKNLAYRIKTSDLLEKSRLNNNMIK